MNLLHKVWKIMDFDFVTRAQERRGEEGGRDEQKKGEERGPQETSQD